MDRHILLENFERRLKNRLVRLHGCVLMENGVLTAERYRPPYTAKTPTRMYSASKSVVAVAIGRLVGEGKLSLDSRLTDLFADRFDTAAAHPLLKEVTVRHALMMQTAYSKPIYGAGCTDWTASYFKGAPTHPPGMLWHYDSCGSYLLAALVKHISGLDFCTYLRPLFDEIGVSRDLYCLEGPDGEAWGGSGVIATTADIARIANLLLQKGYAGGKQLLPRDYVSAAISPLTRAVDGAGVSPYRCGYGYQIWTLPEGAFAFKGLGGQLAVGFPGRGLVFACTADTAANDTTYNELLDALYGEILPAFPITDRAEYEGAQVAPLTDGPFDEICDREYGLEENPMHIEAVRFEKGDGVSALLYRRYGETKRLEFAIGKERVTLFPEAYSGKRLFDPTARMRYRCSVLGEWCEERTLRLSVYAEDIFVGNLTMHFSFLGDRIAIKMSKNAQFFFDDFVGYAYGTAKKD